MLNVKDLRNYINAEFNILLQGLHGTGKTTMLMKACEQEKLTLKLYNSASMDPFTDLVGVPKFATDDNGNDVLHSVRPRDIDEAEVVFFDELNRADPKTLNAIFELIQFKSINGEKLPKLKCVVAAMNPAEGEYTVGTLDPALVDRFHIFLDVPPVIDKAYMMSKFAPEIANILIKWHADHENEPNRKGYISPRRLETIGNVFLATKSRNALKAAMPQDGIYNFGALYRDLTQALLPESERQSLKQKQQEKQARIQKEQTIKQKNNTDLRTKIKQKGLTGLKRTDITSSSQGGNTSSLILSIMSR